MAACWSTRRCLGLALALGWCAVPAAWAGLGERVESVQRDNAALRAATAKVTPLAHCDVHEMTTAQGATVREYVAADGTVFATTWSGPAMPDLKVLLASHHAQYLAGAQERRGSHHVLALNTEGLVLRVVKLPRGIAGSAHLSALVPAGMDIQDIR
jgi:hypothetical protein